MLDSRAVTDALASYDDPVFGPLISTALVVKSVLADQRRATVEVELGFPSDRLSERLHAALSAHLADQLNCDIQLALTWRVQPQAVQPKLQPLSTIRNIIAVASGKGGVGKSTVTANLALALRDEGARVGVLDADIYGPSQPRMLGAAGEEPKVVGENRMLPVVAQGMQTMSIGYLVDEKDAMIWRGPMVTQALSQLLFQSVWDDLDYLLIDLPPGTGDTHLSLAQKIPVSGTIVVTTPQDIALLDARKGIDMFRKVEVPILGVVENMSTHVCSQCGHEEAVFGSDGGQSLSDEAAVPLLGQLPLSASIRLNADNGAPTVASDPESDIASRYRQIALSAAMNLVTTDAGAEFPEIVIEEDA